MNSKEGQVELLNCTLRGRPLSPLLALLPQTLLFALYFLHFTPSCDVFQNETINDYLGSNFLESPKRLPRTKKGLSRIEFQNSLFPSFAPSFHLIFAPSEKLKCLATLKTSL